MAEEIKKEVTPPITEEVVKTSWTKEEVDELLKGRLEQKDVDKIVTERLAREKKNFEKEKSEALRLATLTAEEKTAELLKIKESELTAKEKAILQKEVILEISEQLKAEGLPTKFAKSLMGETTEETMQNIKDFKKDWQEQLQTEIKKKVANPTPAAGTQTTQEEALLQSARKIAGLIK